MNSICLPASIRILFSPAIVTIVPVLHINLIAGWKMIRTVENVRLSTYDGIGGLVR
jgi:hypothetical protein